MATDRSSAQGSRAGRGSRGRDQMAAAGRPRRLRAKGQPRLPAKRQSGERERDRLREEVLRSAARESQRETAADEFDRARDLLARGRDGAAVQAAQRAKALAPRSGAVREVLGIGLYRAERYREALRELLAYRRITGRFDQNHLIADSYRAIGDAGKAVPIAREAMRARIGEDVRAEAAIVGASALSDMGRHSEAVGLLRSFPARAKASRAFDLRLWYVTGDVLERAGRTPEAAEEFRRVVRHDPGAFDAAERLAALGG